MVSNKLVQHYNQVVESYDDLPFYRIQGDSVQQLRALLLPYTYRKSLLDIGAGTCSFAELLKPKSMTCVDVSASMLYQRPQSKNQEKILGSGIEFLKNTTNHYEVCLIKECLHHFSNAEQNALFQVCHHKVTTLIIVLRLKDNVYPWFHEAQKSYENTCVDMYRIEKFLKKSGYSTSVKELTVSINLTSNEWIAMLKKRFWSNLENMSDIELNQGINQLQKGIEPQVQFNDKVTILINT